MSLDRDEPDRTPTKKQIARAMRSIAVLQSYHVPIFKNPVLYTSDDARVNLRSGPEVASRMLVLWAVELRAEGMPQEEALALIEESDLLDELSPNEKRFLHDPEPDADQRRGLIWRLESIWVLLWSLRQIDQLNWPHNMCDVPQLVKLMKPIEGNSDFIRRAATRSKEQLLDAQDLTMRIHWAIRDAWSNKRPIPTNLDWSKPLQMVPVTACHAVGVVEQRHHALNWLVRLDNADWDKVDTST